MNIRKKTLFIFLLTFLSLGLITITVSNFILLRGFVRLEERDTELNVQRVVSAFNDELMDLDDIVWDWASWDDTYAFIQDANQEYIESNLVNGTFIDLEINFMLFVDTNDQVVYGKSMDLIEESVVPISESLVEHLKENRILTHHVDTESNINGTILLSEGPALISSRPILTSDEEGPIRGALIMGRYFDSSRIEYLAETTHLSLTVYKFDDPQLPTDFQQAMQLFTDEEQIVIQTFDKESINGYALLKDVYDNPALLFRVDLPRLIYAQGLLSILSFVVSLSASFIIIGIIAILLLDRIILTRLTALSADVNRIETEGDFSMRVKVEGNDELSSLSSDVNGMISALEKAQAELLRYTDQLEEMIEEKSRDLLEAEHFVAAGKVASMIGHDLRSPLQNIQNAVYLLKMSPDKTDDMLAIIENALDRSVKMLEELRNKTMDKPLKLVETDLALLIQKTIKSIMIPTTIEVNVILREDMISLYIDPLMIQRVLDNLIRNSLDAMPDGGSLELIAEKTKDEVKVVVSDTGIGIPKEELHNIFKPFYTTKKKGLGLGLAYCKRAIEAHGGTITVESQTGEGTVFTISLPIHHRSQDIYDDHSTEITDRVKGVLLTIL